MTKTLTEQVLNLQRMVEDECSRRCELERKLAIATKALKEYSWGNNWLDAGARGQVFLPTKRGYSIADKALDEMEGVK